MDTSAVSMILRDLGELGFWFPVGTAVVFATLALPVAAVVAVRRGFVLAWAPLARVVGLYVSWFVYYATDWWSNPGHGIWMAQALLVVVAWAMFGIAIRAGRLSDDRP